VQDTTATFADARASKAFPVAEPTGLGAGWRAISTVFRSDGSGAILRVGYVAPSGDTAQLVESNQPTDALLPTELGDHQTNQGTADVGGRPWQVLAVRNGQHALVDLAPDRTIIVVGGASLAELRELAASLA
jgi:hypothetical protein